MVQNVQLTSRLPKLTRMDDPMISFTEEDAQRVHHPHNDALVINLTIANFNTWQILVDNGSSADIFCYPAFQQMRIGKEWLMPLDVPLVGFGRTKVMLVRFVMLSVNIGTYPQQITKDVTFLVMDCSSAYNAIIERPTLNAWRAATSTYHLLLKFPIECGIGEAHGDQMVARECYVSMLEMDEQVTTMNIEEPWVNVELTKGLETISLDDEHVDRITRIGTQANPSVRNGLILFLRDNLDIFAWSYEDMLGIYNIPTQLYS